MNERRFDISAFVAGLVFIGIGVAFLLDRLDVWDLQMDLLLPLTVIGMGAAVLLGAVANRSRA